jgi:hypothetical protein
VAERDHARALQQVEPGHADQDGGEHELEDGHVAQLHGAHLPVEAQHAALLQQESEHQTVISRARAHSWRAPP